MNIYKGDCRECGGWVGILNNFGVNDEILCGECYSKIPKPSCSFCGKELEILTVRLESGQVICYDCYDRDIRSA